MKLPVIIQGGMGVGVSGWQLARAVSRTGQLGVVSGTAMDQIFIRGLRMGDPDKSLRMALSHFPNQTIAQNILDRFFIPGGNNPEALFQTLPQLTIQPSRIRREVLLVANFAAVFLAKQGHQGMVGINLLEKIQLPNLCSLYGAMLAGVDFVVMGAGIPVEIPGVLDRFALHEPASLKVAVQGSSSGDHTRLEFHPRSFFKAKLPTVKRPLFLCIVSSDTLAKMMQRKAHGRVDGFVVERPSAGGHNAPPRGKMVLNENQEPVYSDRDEADLEKIKAMGLPFWLAGSYGSPEKLEKALEMGAQGIQVGTAFSLAEESGYTPALKQRVKNWILRETPMVFTDPKASPTGFPFKVLSLPGTLSEEAVYRQRTRICDLGYLRHPYRRPDQTIGYRCPAEPLEAYVKKGGKREDTVGRKCLCNALLANIGHAPPRKKPCNPEKELVTIGNDTACLSRLIRSETDTYTAADVVDYLLTGLPDPSD